jgi:hypothetical protein
MRSNHGLAMEYIARLLCWTVNHNGPTKRNEIQPWLRKDAVQEFMDCIYAPPRDLVLRHGHFVNVFRPDYD